MEFAHVVTALCKQGVARYKKLPVYTSQLMVFLELFYLSLVVIAFGVE
jgi:hypothetical protein